MTLAADTSVSTQTIIACVWDFDKTLIPGHMQWPLFEHFGVDGDKFWKEVNQLPEIYAKRGLRVSPDTIYLNHLISYVRNGPFKGLNNKLLRELGGKLNFFPGLPDFFRELQEIPQSRSEFRAHDLRVEHYVISNGLAEMIRGSKIAPFVENIYGCELIENPCPPGYDVQSELEMDTEGEICQVGFVVDNTIKTRFIFEINKGTNKNSDIDVNSHIQHEDRRIPISNMIYIADGPSDVPAFAVVGKNGGKTYAVYEKGNQKEFAQNDTLLRTRRIQAYGPADYTSNSSTAMWMKMHLTDLCEKIVQQREAVLASRMAKPPTHIREDKPQPKPLTPSQNELFTQPNE